VRSEAAEIVQSVSSAQWEGGVAQQPKPVSPEATPAVSQRLNFDYTGSSETMVLAVVRAVQSWREKWPNTVPKRYQVKEAAGKSGGAADKAIDFASVNLLVTPDFALTDLGERFLRERT
jgi:hypothetical protein